MTFAFSDRHIDEYRTQGYTVFRQLLPPSLVADLRRVCAEARDLARQQRGPQAQRLQPIADFPLDQQPFADYAALPLLNDALHRLLSPDFRVGGPQVMGVLFEPAEWPWCTHWHRDWRDNMPGLELARWDEHFADDRYFNQVNCALYADSCTWVVPGSHLRRDLPSECRRFPERPIATPDLAGRSATEYESICREYAQSMPGARQLFLDAGDFCLYRNTLWHIGNYVPYAKRATLHDAVDTDEFAAWRNETLRVVQERRAAGHGMENPNLYFRRFPMTATPRLTKAELDAGLHHIRQAPKDEGLLALIVRRPAIGEREVLATGELDLAEGLVGDNWRTRGSSRSANGRANPETQLTIMNARAIAHIAQDKGRWPLAGDQLFIDMDISAANMPPGTRLAIGSAVVEVTPAPHNGCKKFVAHFGLDAMKWVNSAVGKALHLRGINARVVEPGTIRTGDAVARVKG